jgi:hypothetical protein
MEQYQRCLAQGLSFRPVLVAGRHWAAAEEASRG